MSIRSTTSVDVVVVGGGVAGMCAAIAAHDAGAQTLLLEASPLIGGTASWSGGAVWVPVNHHLQAAGGADSRAAALEYMRHCAEGKADETVYTAYLDQAAGVIAWLEAATPLRFEMGTMPDYQGGVPGGMYKQGMSRSVAPEIFNLSRLGAQQALLRRSPYGTLPFGFQEFSHFGAVLHPERIDPVLYADRLQQGFVGWGEALSAALLAGLLERGVEIRTDTRARYVTTNGRVTGVLAETATENLEVIARRGVILCAGGYEWDEELMQRNFPGIPFVPSTVPSDTGDGWRMAEAAGAAMENSGACWGWPGYLVPGENIAEGTPLVRTALVERTLPHMIIVNRNGRRFVDESLPYHTILKRLIERDANGNFSNLPAYHLFDQQFRDKYAFGPVMPGQQAPAWMKSFASLLELAAATGINAAGLEEGVARFNATARNGVDPEFNRGTTPYGNFWGDVENPLSPNLGTLEKPPFYAVEVLPSTIGTCGGPRIDSHGRVLGADGTPIGGLFAAGNVTAAISGPSYFGPGGTIGPAMVFGVLAGRCAAQQEIQDDGK